MPHFKWDNIRYQTLADLPVSVEDNGRSTSFLDLTNATLKADWNVAIYPNNHLAHPPSTAEKQL